MPNLDTGPGTKHEPRTLTTIRLHLARTLTRERPTEQDTWLAWLVRMYDNQSGDNATLAQQLEDARSVIQEYEAAQPPIDEDRLRSANRAR